MAVTEKIESRAMHFSREIQSLPRKFICTWNDFNNGGDGIISLPVIGSYYSPARPDLICTDIQVNPVPENTDYCHVDCTFSNFGQPFPQNQPETIASIEQVFDFTFSPSDNETYWDFGLKAAKTWTERYQTFVGDTEAYVPPRIPEGPQITLTLGFNVNSWDLDIVEKAIGCVNTNKFLEAYIDRYVIDTEGEEINVEAIDYTGDDAEKWLFAGFHSEIVGRDPGSASSRYPNYRVTETFLYSGPWWTWNAPYDITDYQPYQKADFDKLPKPDESSVSIEYGLR